MNALIRKEFVRHESGQLILSNQKETWALIEDRVAKLKSVHGDKEKTDTYIENLFEEFQAIIDYDKETAILPEPFGEFESEDEKAKWIENRLIAQDLDIHIGAILYNYHEWLAEVGLPDIILGRFVVDYPALYERVLYDYIGVLKGVNPDYGFQLVILGDNSMREEVVEDMQRELFYKSRKAYTATIILPSLIEHFLIGFTQQGVVKSKTKELFRLIDQGVIKLTVDDMKFMKQFLRESRYMEGSRDTSMKRCFDILKNHSLINEEEGYSPIIRGRSSKGNLTLGTFIRNEYVKQNMKPVYHKTMDMLFSVEKLNLRNAIMHGASSTFDPYAMCVTAIMLQLFWQIMGRSVMET